MSEELKRGIPKAIPTGKIIEFSEEEKIRHDKDTLRLLKDIGVLDENATLDDLEEIKLKK